MKKRKAKKVAQHRTELDRIATQLRTALRRETTNIIEIGKLLLESRKLLANEHGKWLPWLKANFDLSQRTAYRYLSAAEYAASKVVTVTTLSNLSHSVLYQLAGGDYTPEEEAEIPTQAKAGKRIDQDRAWNIRERLASPGDDDDDDDDNDDNDEDAAAAEDAESAAILDGPPPDVPPPAAPVATDYATPKFDALIDEFARLITKPAAAFDRTTHTHVELKAVADFILAVAALVVRSKQKKGRALDESACADVTI